MGLSSRTLGDSLDFYFFFSSCSRVESLEISTQRSSRQRKNGNVHNDVTQRWAVRFYCFLMFKVPSIFKPRCCSLGIQISETASYATRWFLRIFCICKYLVISPLEVMYFNNQNLCGALRKQGEKKRYIILMYRSQIAVLHTKQPLDGSIF